MTEPQVRGTDDFTELGTQLAIDISRLVGWQKPAGYWSERVRAIEAAARDEGRREAVRLLRLAERDYSDGLTEEESDAFIADVRAFLDEVAGLNASESAQPPEASE